MKKKVKTRNLVSNQRSQRKNFQAMKKMIQMIVKKTMKKKMKRTMMRKAGEAWKVLTDYNSMSVY